MPDHGSSLVTARGLRILVTGATGLVGGELCRRLMLRGHRVLALVRGDGAIRPAEGGPLAGVERLRGDVRDPPDPSAVPPFDLLLHAAAVTGFGAPEALARAVNVGGTARLLALAEARGAAFLHVGTAYVCGAQDGAVDEAPASPDACHRNAYEATKAEAERLVLAAAARGLCAAVARPSIVVGLHGSGAVPRFDGIYALLRLAGEGRVSAMPAAPGATLDLVPLCHVADGLCDVAERMAAARGRVFHLASGAPVALAAFCAVARHLPGFAAPRLVAPDGFDAARLPPDERWWHERVVCLFAPYMRQGPRFATDGLRALSGRVCPPVDAAFLRRLCLFAVRAGFLRPQRLPLEPLWPQPPWRQPLRPQQPPLPQPSLPQPL